MSALTTTQVKVYTDGLAKILKNAWRTLGDADPAETTTLTAIARTVDQTFETSLDNGELYAATQAGLKEMRANLRYDLLFGRLMGNFAGNLVGQLDTQARAYFPSDWTMTDTTVLHPFEAWLLRQNGAYSVSAESNGTAIATPGSAGAVAVANTSGGGLQVGNHYIKHTLIGNADYKESLPSPASLVATITNSTNSITYTIAGTVPTGVTKVRIYRTKVGAASGSDPMYYDQQVSVTPGASYPVITLTKRDQSLDLNTTYPAWMSCLVVPEFAFCWAQTFAATNGLGGLSAVDKPMAFSTGQMLNASLVAAGPGDASIGNTNEGFLGLGNTLQSSLFGTYVIGTGLTVANPQLANVVSTNTQGFAGAIGGTSTGLRMRVTSALNAVGAGHTLSYQYWDATTGWGGSLSTASAAAVTTNFAGTAATNVALWDIAAGRVVRNITATVAAGGTTSGTVVIEARPVRSY